MKTDNDYIYPETAEELAMFYGWECEVHRQGQDIWVTYEELIGVKALSTVGPFPCKYRLPLPTISDLKVGDVVREDELTTLYYILDEDATEDLEGWQLLIGRNTWVPVKCN